MSEPDGRYERAGETTPRGNSSERVGFYRFLRYSHVLSSLLRELLEERFLQEVSSHRMTRAQFCFLKLITLNPDLQVGEVARCLGVSAAASSKTVDKLARLGLVTRETSAEDRRATLVTPSEEGRALVRDFEKVKAERLAPVFDSLGPEGDRLCELLEQICLGLLGSEGPMGRSCLRCAGYYHADCSIARVQGNCALAAERCVRSGATAKDALQ